MKTVNLLGVVVACVLVVGGCSFSDMGRDLGGGLGEGLAPQADTIAASFGGGLIRGVRDSLTSKQTRDSLEKFLDGIIGRAGLSANKSVVALRDSILNASTQAWVIDLEKALMQELLTTSTSLQENLLGKRTQKSIAAIRDSLLGARTLLFAAALRDTIVGERLREELSLLRDDLLGSKTRDAVDSLLARVTGQLQGVAREEEGFLKKNITEILWTAGGVLALLVVLTGLVIAKLRRYKTMLATVSNQIHHMPDQSSYDELTRRIQKKTQEVGVEKKFRDFLTELGLKGESSWKG